MAGKVVNMKVCSPLKLRSGLTGKYHAICHYSYNLPLANILNPHIMKTLASSILLTLITITGFSQVQSDCEKSWGLDHYYKKDVAFLAFERLYEIKSPDTNEIIIPQVFQDSIWNGLAAIYNAFSIQQRDSIFDIYCLHNSLVSGSPLYPGIIVELDTTYEWTSNWLNGEITTGIDELDSFTSEYNYTIQIIYNNTNQVVINSDLPLNPNPVSDSLLLFNGIIDAYPDLITSNGNKIDYNISGNNQFFDFTIAWGDCMSGCIYHHKWKFKVNFTDCIVEYLGLETNREDDFPNPVNCNITSIEPNNSEITKLLLYPNPTSDRITIETKNIKNIEIFNSDRIVENLKINNQDIVKIDLEKLISGLYLIKIKTEKEVIISKFIKK